MEMSVEPSHAKVVDDLDRWANSPGLQPPKAPHCSMTASPPPSAATVLSPREMEIINHMARGLTNKEIARALRVTPETIKWHLKNIYEKLNVSSRGEAVRSGLGGTGGNETGS